MKALENYKIENAVEKKYIKDKEAFEKIYDVYAVRIFRFIYLKTSSKETAEDLTSEVFLKCWRYIKNIGERSSDDDFLKNEKIGPFIYKVARNLLIDFYRKKQFITVEIDQEIKNRISDGKQDIFRMVGLKEDIEEARKALRDIKDEYREVIILRHVENLQIEEIAEVMEKNEGSVRTLIHRAMKSLGKKMEERKNKKDEELAENSL